MKQISRARDEPAAIKGAWVQRDLSTIDLLGEYLCYLRTEGFSKQYRRRVEQRVVSLVEACGWSNIINVSPGRFLAWRVNQAFSASTLNQYHAEMDGLLGWLVSRRGLESNPLASVERLRHPRHIAHD